MQKRLGTRFWLSFFLALKVAFNPNKTVQTNPESTFGADVDNA
jgi:hypothetical protein